MFLPKYFKNNQSGQVLVIFLLVLVIGLALVLSIASRTVTDIRQTTTSDESNRAYFAAESGVEDALKKIESNPSFTSATPYALNFTSVNQTNADVTVTALTKPAGEILDFLEYSKDDVAQINMMGDFNILDSRSGGGHAASANAIATTDVLNIFWGLDSNVSSYTSFANTPAIEVSVVTFDGSNWGIRKMTFSAFAGSNFCTSAVSVDPADSGKYRYKVALDLDTTNGCSNGNETVNASPVLARVRFINAGGALGISLVGKDLPQQGQKITSVGETPSGVSRKLEVNRFYPTLPAIFDYVLYNGSTQPLCKGSC